MQIELHPLAGGHSMPPARFLEAVLESRVSLMQWMPWCHAGYGAADVERWFAEADDMWRGKRAYPMLIVAADGRLLGGVGVHDVLHYGKREAEVGYWVRQSARGVGVAATAIRAMAAFAFNELGLVRISMRIRLDNRSSRRAAERADASFEGVARHGLLHAEARFDAAVYSLLPSDLARAWTL